MGCRTLVGTRFRLWQSDISGRDTSEAVFCPYTFAHLASGSLQFLLIPPVFVAKISIDWFFVNLGLHLAFEILENTPWCIRFCRENTADSLYKGDSLVNSFGDLIAFSASYILTRWVWVTWETVFVVALPITFMALHFLFY